MQKKFPNFKTIRKVYIKELKCHLLELQHEKCGATIIHIANNDDENLFCLSLKTLPKNSSGVAHILEHITLSGSKKFPIKDPFFSMSRKSLNTFMNAMTGQDFTCYPAASQISKDFYNLLDVYLDSVFHPLLKKAAFLQEGHRLELKDNTLQAKGVVYNEMKGSLNSAENRLFHLTMKHLLPDLPYAYNSGGEPKEILKLSYEELLDFYKTYYDPSRCIFFFYGHLPLKQHLNFLEKEIFQYAEAKMPLPPMPKQTRFLTPLTITEKYPAREDENQALISFNFLTCSIDNQKDLLALTLLDNILMETDASLLKHALLSSGMCTSATSSLFCEMTEIPWSLTLKGCKTEDHDRLFDLILSTLSSIKIPKSLIKASLHQLAFNRTEISSLPYGLNLFFRSALLKQQGIDPLDGLCLKSLFKHIEKDIHDPDFFPKLIRKYFIDNPHVLKLTMLPDANLGQEEEKEEENYLNTTYLKLTPDDKKRLNEETDELKNYQKEIENASYACLPRLSLNDIQQEPKNYPLIEEEHAFHHNGFTNQILYTDLIFDLPHSDNLPLLSLFSSLFFEIGNGKRNYKKNLKYMQAHVGKIYSYINAYNHIDDPQNCHPVFAIRGKCFYKKSQKLFEIIQEQLTTYNFKDKKRIKEFILQQKTLLENNINQNSMQYAINSCLKDLSSFSHIMEQCHGLSYYQYLKNLTEKNIDEIIDALDLLGKKMISPTKMDIVITCEENFYKKLKTLNFYDMRKWSTGNRPAVFSPKNSPFLSSDGFIIASPVAYNCLGINSITYSHEDAPALSLATHLLDNKVLHPKIREEGGAYGSGSNYIPLNGNFYFYSYRDPNLYDTMSIFKESISQIAEVKFSNEDFEDAKFQAFQGLDAPILPGKRGISAYNMLRTGKTYEKRSIFRKKIFSLTKEEVAQAVRKHINLEKPKIVSFASEQMLQKDQTKFIPPMTVKKI